MRIKKPIAFMGIGVCLFLAAFVSAQYEVPKQTGPDSTPFQWPKGKRAAISLTFDDARLSQIDNGLPLLDRHRVRATFFVTPRAVEKRCSAGSKPSGAGTKSGIIR